MCRRPLLRLAPSRKRRNPLLLGTAAVVLLAGIARLILRPHGPSPVPSPTLPDSGDMGELTLVSMDPAVRVRVHSHAEAGKGGVLRPGLPVPLAAGDYDLALDPDALAGLRLSKTTLKVAPGERQAVRASRACR